MARQNAEASRGQRAEKLNIFYCLLNIAKPTDVGGKAGMILTMGGIGVS
jgi:hypothetical protein